ncbi:MAG TPA: [protein-PII] uridylyltransferase [Burkholderiales bacterium]|nr:[protein-PII] uridylyltransferase [Burkholderiales bacterium]
MSSVVERAAAQSRISDWRRRVAVGRAGLAEAFRADGDAKRYLRRHRLLIDSVLREVWEKADLPRGCTLVAVGGYGRGEQFPHSDVDLLILLPDDATEAEQTKLETFIGGLWDLGMDLGTSVRSVAQCSTESTKDITVQTALLESRYLCGSRALFNTLYQTLHGDFDAQKFFVAKRLEQDQRHAKHQDSPYSLEPNLKEAPGGLRDLHVILWISRASGLGDDWRALAAHGLITRAEALRLKRHELLLQEIRIRLHLLTDRGEERILFDFQDALAREFDCVDLPGKRASEVFMQRYYRTAKAITQLNEILIQNISAALFPTEHEHPPEPINERFQAVRELLDARDPNVFEREPDAILESFLLLQQHSELKGMTAPTLRALWRARAIIDGKFRRNPQHKAQFLAILQEPRGIVHELRRMNRYSILGRYLPAFGKVVGQMQHDLFHVYTVDQHIMMVVRNLRRFTLLEYAHEYPLCSRLMNSFERYWLLYLAALFHDIAKGRGGDHSQLGEVEAARFCRSHGLPREDAELVEFLVAQHLTMSSVAQKRDLSDPDVIREFAALVKSERRLTALYLLTVADIRGTSPKVWNAWKGKLLEDLYRATRRLLRGDNVGFDQDVQNKQSEALRMLRLYGLSDEVAETLWRELDVPYFLRHDAQDISWQTRNLYNRVRTERPIVKARLAPFGEGLQVMAYCKDERDIFARICGYFESINFNIVDAKIHTTKHGYALDTFLVMGTGKAHYRDLINLIEYNLAERLANKAPLGPPTRGRISRQSKHFPITPEVTLRPDEKNQYQILFVAAGDRPGLLYSIARVLSEHDVRLHSAKIVTLGERAEDVFLISGPSLAKEKAILQLEQDTLRALQA